MGWAFFLNHADEAIRLTAKVAPDTTPERLASDARIMAQLMTDEMVPIGYVNSERWIRNGKKLAQLSQLPYVEEQSRNALFDEYLAGRSKRWSRLLLYGLCSALGFVFLLGGVALLLGRTVTRRTSEFSEISHDRELNVKNLVENNIFAIGVIDGKGVLVFVNRLFETLSGYSTAEIMSTPTSFQELVSEPQQKHLVTYAFLESEANELPPFFELDMICKSGETVPVECAVRPILWHDQPYRYIVVRDISERLKSEQKLRDSEALFRTVAEGAFDGVSLVDAAGVFVYVNEKLATTTQYPVAELVGAHYSEFMCAEDFRRMKLRFKRRQRREQWFREFDSRLSCRDGTTVPVSVSIREVCLSGRQAFVIAYKDISVRKRMERELLQIAEWERIRIAQSLHDTVGQDISGMAYLMEVLSGKLKRDQSVYADSAIELANATRQSHQQLREVVKALLPLAGETKLAEALEHLCRNMRAATRATFSLVDDGLGQVKFQPMVAEHLRCIAQEASANAVRHGKAKNIVISLTHENGMGALRIDDDGCGFDVDKQSFPGSGLTIMNYRADIIEGILSIHRREGGGMSVLCTFILPHAVDQAKT